MLVGGAVHAVVAPTIRVEVPSGTALVNGGIVNFGNAAQNDGTVDKIVTIKNSGTGSSSLTITSVTLSGTNPGDFSIDQTGLSSSLGASQSTTFVVTFAPTALGKRTATLTIRSNDSARPTFTATITGAGIPSVQPAIAVTGPTNAVLASSTQTDFGSAVHAITGNSSVVKTFHIKNTGNNDNTLDISSVTVTGTNASDFAVSTTDMSTSLASNTTTSFTVTFTPSATGIRRATLNIASNATNGTTFTTLLIANGVGPASFSFNTATLNLNEGAKVAALTVNRSNSAIAQSITINTDDGTASAYPPFSAAVAGTDYTDLTGGATTVSFLAGQSSKIVNVTLSPKTGSQPNKTFSATISNPSDFGTLGSISTVKINILATDVVKPVLTVDNPVNNSTADASVTSSITVDGSVSDLNGVSKITVTANGTTVPATLDTASVTGTSVPFSASFVPQLGSNKVTVTAYDLRNNASATVTRTVTLTGGALLTVTRSVPGAISTKPDLAGKVTLTASPSTHANPLSPTTPNALSQTALAIPGTAMHLTASSFIGYAFKQWTGLPSGAVAVGNVADFVMPGTPQSVTAEYVVSPFKGSANTTDSFYGLVTRDTTASPLALDSVNTDGYIVGAISETTGVFTGSILIDGANAQSFSVTFFGDGTSSTGGSSPTGYLTLAGGRTMSLSFDFNTSHDVIKVSTTKGGVTSKSDLTRGYYSATRKVNPSLLNHTTYGSFTLDLPPADNSATFAAKDYPQGDGFGTLKLDNTGKVSIVGTLADGSTFTASSALTSASVCPIFAQLTTPGGSTRLGVLDGFLTFASNPSTDLTATLFWIRPATSQALYTAGWQNGLAVNLEGAAYNSATTVATGLGLSSPNLTSGNASITFSQGKLPTAVVQTLFNITGNTVTYIGSTANNLHLTITAGNDGTFSGYFAPSWTSPSKVLPTFSGAILQKGSSPTGYGFFISNRTGDADPESGLVILSAQD